jgi:hypothetical protein
VGQGLSLADAPPFESSQEFFVAHFVNSEFRVVAAIDSAAEMSAAGQQPPSAGGKGGRGRGGAGGKRGGRTGQPGGESKGAAAFRLKHAMLVAAAKAFVTAAAASSPAGFAAVVPPTCTVGAYKGCFVDTAAVRVLNFTAAFGTQPSDFPTMSRETCAQACCAAGFVGDDVLVGVEYAVQCFCGHGFAGGVTPPASSGCQSDCPGHTGETCGGSDAIDVFVASCPGASSPGNLCANPFAPQTGPEFHGCADAGAVGTYGFVPISRPGLFCTFGRSRSIDEARPACCLDAFQIINLKPASTHVVTPALRLFTFANSMFQIHEFHDDPGIAT